MVTIASETPEPGPAHRLHTSELIARLRTDERRGLGDDEVRARLTQYGLNELAVQKPAPPWRRFLAQFQDVLVILLLVATGISAALWVVERDAALPYEAIAIPRRFLHRAHACHAAAAYDDDSHIARSRLCAPARARCAGKDRPLRHDVTADVTERRLTWSVVATAKGPLLQFANELTY